MQRSQVLFMKHHVKPIWLPEVLEEGTMLFHVCSVTDVPLSYNITVDLLGFLWVCDSECVDLQASFMRHHRIEMNWRVKPIRSPKVLKGHDDHVITCLQFSGNRIVSGSDDNTLKVWSATTGKVRLSAFKHQIMKFDNVFCSRYSQLWIFWEKIMLYLNLLYYCTFVWFCYCCTVDILACRLYQISQSGIQLCDYQHLYD